MVLVKSHRYKQFLAALSLIAVTLASGIVTSYARANDESKAAPMPAAKEVILTPKQEEKSNLPEPRVALATRTEEPAAAALSPAAGKPAKTATAPAIQRPPAATKVNPVTASPSAGTPGNGVKKPAQILEEDDMVMDDAYGDELYDNDPWEPLNRSFFEFNRAVDKILLRPVAQAYRGVVPERGRVMVTDFLGNIYTPVTFANSLLQCDLYNTFASFWRFVINSTFGIGGLFDVASEAGLTMRDTDLGQTFAIHGADAGPYFVIPFVGPSTVRDALGRVGDAFLFPVNYMEPEVFVPVLVTTVIDARSNNMKIIDDIYSTSLDPYATFRSAYLQKRASDIRRAKEAREDSFTKMKAH